MASPVTTTAYGKYVDLQNYTGAPTETSGSIVLSGSAASELLYTNVGMDMPSIKLDSGATCTTIKDEDNMASDSATALATQQSIKAYVDSQVGGADLDYAGDSGTGAVDLDSQSFTIAGTANEITTAASGQTLTISLPDNVTIGAALTVTTTLTANGNTTLGDAASDVVTATAQLTASQGGTFTRHVECDHTLNVDGASTFAAGTFSGLLTANGNVDLGNATTDSITCTGRFDADLIPLADSTSDLGTSALQWAEAHIDTGHIDTVTATNVDGILGANTAAAATVTTLTGSGAANLKSLHCDSVNLDGGNIDGVTIGAASAAAGTFAALVGTTVSGSGAAQFTSLHCDSVNLDGGNIDGVTIGATSAAAGTFAAVVGTSATFSSTLTANGDTDLGNATSDTITCTGRFDSDLVPSSDSARDLGTSALQWADIHADAGYIDAITVTGTSTLTTVDINGGAIDGVTLGSNSAVTALTVNGGNAQSITSTGANNVTLTAGNNLIFDAQGTDEDDGVIFSLGADNDNVVFDFRDNSGNSLLMGDGSGVWEHNGTNKAAADFVFNADTDTDKITFDSGENALIVYDGGSETMRFGGDATSDYALDVKDGSNNINKVRAAAFVTYSDERLKTDVEPMSNALRTVNSLKAVNFTWKKDGTQDFGFLAQDLKKAIPQAVHGNEDGLYGVDYGRLTSVLVGAIQEQSAQIKALQEKLDK